MIFTAKDVLLELFGLSFMGMVELDKPFDFIIVNCLGNSIVCNKLIVGGKLPVVTVFEAAEHLTINQTKRKLILKKHIALRTFL